MLRKYGETKDQFGETVLHKRMDLHCMIDRVFNNK